MDIHSLILVVGISHLIQGIAFSFQFKISRAYPGLGWWLLWCIAEIIGFTCLLLRSYTGILPYVIMVQNISIFSGTIFIYIGLCRFFGKRENLKIIIPALVLYVLGLLFFLLVIPDISIRSAIIALMLSFTAFLTAGTMFRQPIAAIRSTVYFNGVIFVAHGMFLLVRFFIIIFTNPDMNVLTPTFLQISLYLDAFVVGLLWTYGFIFMMNQRLNADMTESKKRFESIFNTSPDASLITRPEDGLIMDINNSFTLLTGFTREEAIGNSSLNLWKNSEDRAKVVADLREKGSCDNFESTFMKKNGIEMIGLLSAKMITLGGKPYIISVTRDISERKRSEMVLKESEAKLKELNATKDKFFSIIAHDLMNPLNNILGFIEVILSDFEDLDKKDLLKYMKIVDTSSRQAYALLDNLLLWARSHTGTIDFRPETLNLQNSIQNVFDLLKIPADTKEVTITSRIRENFMVKADKNMLDTILRNLLTNALKFSFRKGKIIVSAEKKSGLIEISVQDNGLGITHEDLGNIFRIDNKTSTLGTEKEKGSGLGLLLCREFVEKNGGRIWAESEFGRGSVFRFTLPVAG